MKITNTRLGIHISSRIVYSIFNRNSGKANRNVINSANP